MVRPWSGRVLSGRRVLGRRTAKLVQWYWARLGFGSALPTAGRRQGTRSDVLPLGVLPPQVVVVATVVWPLVGLLVVEAPWRLLAQGLVVHHVEVVVVSRHLRRELAVEVVKEIVALLARLLLVLGPTRLAKFLP